MTDLEAQWPAVRKVYNSAFLSSLHATMSSVSTDGIPHATPIGSLHLKRDCTAVYFEIFTRQLAVNLDENQQICVLAVNSGKLFWLRSLYHGRFATPPAIRLLGTAGKRREATEDEIAWWQRRVRRVRRLKGYDILWHREKCRTVRELHFTKLLPIVLGEMTRGHWSGKS